MHSINHTFLLATRFLLALSIVMVAVQAENPSKQTTVNEITTLQEIKALLLKTNDPVAQLPLVKKGLQIAQKNQDLQAQLYFTFQLGKLYQNFDIQDEAFGYFLQAAGLSQVMKDTLTEVAVRHAIAQLFLSRGMITKAKAANQKAFNLVKKLNHPQLMAASYAIKGRIQQQEGNTYNALDNFFKAHALYKSLNDEAGSIAQLMELAWIYKRNHLNDKAEKALNQVRSLLDSLSSPATKASVFYEIARYHESEGNLREAMQDIDSAEKIACQANLFPEQVKILKLRARLFQKKGLYQLALIASNRFIELKDSLNSQNSQKELRRLEAEYQSQQQKERNRMLSEQVQQQRRIVIILIVSLIFLSLMIALLYNRMRLRRREQEQKLLKVYNKELAHQVEARTRELQLEIQEKNKKSAEAEQARIKAQESDKLKEEFLLNINDEFRNPMNRIFGYSEILLEELKNADHRQMAKTIFNDSQKLISLLTDIIDLSRLKSEQIELDIQAFPLHEVLNPLYDNFVSQAKKGIHFEADFQEAAYERIVHTDKQRLTNALTQILRNAFKFTQKGKVTFRTFIEKALIKFQITDTGQGIKKEDLAVIFNYFRQGDGSTTRHHGGVGAGLTIAKHLTELLGGRVYVDSEWQQGTVFTLIFPVSAWEPPKKQPKKNYSDSHVPDWSQKHLLVLDAHEAGINLIETSLQETGIQILGCSSEKVALQYLNNENFPIDLVLINDNVSPKGIKNLIVRIKSAHYTLPLILLKRAGNIEKNEHPGPEETILKPVTYLVLLEKLSYYLNE